MVVSIVVIATEAITAMVIIIESIATEVIEIEAITTDPILLSTDPYLENFGKILDFK